MGIADKVIVTADQVAGLYAKLESRGYGFLEDAGLLPLKVGTLDSERGRSLLHLANWVYLSGHIRSDYTFKPSIAGKKDFLDYLLGEYLGDLGEEFRIERGGKNSNKLTLSSHSGAFGRLLNAMGVPRAEKTKEGIDHKWKYETGLPHYFTFLSELTPERNPVR